jgi:siroheme synthase-like protein
MLLNVSERLIVIIGGGAVAARKAAGVLEAGAKHVRVVSPEFREDFPPNVERVNEAYRAAHLDGAGLVFAATDDADVNDAIVRDAHARGLLVCRADSDDELPGDFITPAQFARGPVQVTVSAGSAALAALLRDLVAERWDDGWTRMAEVMVTLRPQLMGDARVDPHTRRAIFRSLATREALDVLNARGQEGLFAWLSSRHPGWTHV